MFLYCDRSGLDLVDWRYSLSCPESRILEKHLDLRLSDKHALSHKHPMQKVPYTDLPKVRPNLERVIVGNSSTNPLHRVRNSSKFLIYLATDWFPWLSLLHLSSCWSWNMIRRYFWFNLALISSHVRTGSCARRSSTSRYLINSTQLVLLVS